MALGVLVNRRHGHLAAQSRAAEVLALGPPMVALGPPFPFLALGPPLEPLEPLYSPGQNGRVPGGVGLAHPCS